MESAVALIEKWGNKLAELAVTVGPEVAELGVKALVLQAIGQLLWGGLLTLIATIIFYSQYRIVLAAKKHYGKYEENGVFGVAGLSIFILSLASIPLAIEGSQRFFDIWNWAWIYDPRLLVAKKIMGL